jgi:hypothetical protein
VARNGHVEAVATCPLLGEERKSLPTFEMTAFDPTRTSLHRSKFCSMSSYCGSTMQSHSDAICGLN